jgi:poly(beta-D-mannuronate) lyase
MPTRHAVVLASVLVASCAEARPGRLRAPFDVEARRAVAGAALPEARPPTPIAPVRDVIGVHYYIDAANSIIDENLLLQNERAFATLRAYERGVVALANGWVRSRPARASYAVLALDALDAWARADALLGASNRQGGHERKWSLAALALAYLEIRDAPGLAVEPRRRVVAWLSRIAGVVVLENDGPPVVMNNHAYWAGLAVALAAVAADDHRLFAWGMERARMGLAQVQPDGTLPLEMARRKRALHYHAFAAAALVLLAELAAANGITLYDENDRALQRLVERVVTGYVDARVFADRAGAVQDVTGPPTGGELAWAEVYCARFDEPTLAAWIAGARPLEDPRLGDLTLLFGRRSPDDAP